MNIDDLLRDLEPGEPPKPTRRERLVTALREAKDIVDEVMGTVGGDSAVRSLMLMTIFGEYLKPDMAGLLPGPIPVRPLHPQCPHFKPGRMRSDGVLATCSVKNRPCIDIGGMALGFSSTYGSCHTFLEAESRSEH